MTDGWYEVACRAERTRIIRLLQDLKAKTACPCAGCESWLSAFDYLIAELDNSDVQL